MIGKVGAGLVALVLVGTVLSMGGSLAGEGRRGELERVLNEVARALAEIDGLRGEARLTLELPRVGTPFELVISGTHGEVQVIRISAAGSEHVERWLLLANEVNGGEFELRFASPASITVLKREAITLELGG